MKSPDKAVNYYYYFKIKKNLLKSVFKKATKLKKVFLYRIKSIILMGTIRPT